MLHCLQSYFLSELALDILSSRSLVLLELLAAVVMQQEGSERQPGDVTASAEPPGQGVEVGRGREGGSGGDHQRYQIALIAAGAPTSVFNETPVCKLYCWLVKIRNHI